MKVKEYKHSDYCEIHKEIKLIHTGDESYDWYECPICRTQYWEKWHAFLKDNAEKWKLKPTWKGGGGLGVTCPCCEGQGLVLPEKANELKERLKL